MEVGDQKANVEVIERLTAENDEVFSSLGQERHELFAQDEVNIIVLLDLDYLGEKKKRRMEKMIKKWTRSGITVKG